MVTAWASGGLVLLVLGIRSVRALTRGHRQTRLPHPGVATLPGESLTRRPALAFSSSPPTFAPPFPLVPRALGIRADGEPTTLSHSTAIDPSIALLGPLEITPAKQRNRGLRSKTQELLVYLALHPKGATTDEVAAALLHDVADERARRRIWRSVSEVRSELGNVLPRSGDHYVLNRKIVAVDIDEFDFLVAQAEAETGTARARLLERSLALVRGEPLAGTDYPWATGDQRHLRAKVVDLLHKLGESRLADDNATGALEVAERAIALDAENESAHRLAMRAESALGLREAVAARYEGLSHDLDARFGLEPGHETRLLFRRLLSQHPKRAEASASEEHEPRNA